MATLVKVAILNAFVDSGKGGNPAGVVLNADALTDSQKLEIARKVGLSETAFVSSSDTADFKLDFFTPQKQIAHCGHATIATFSYLSQQGMVPSNSTSKETIDGNRDIEVLDDFAYMQQLPPKYNKITSEADAVLISLGIATESVISSPTIVNTGNSFLLLGVKSIADMKKLEPDYQRIEELSEKYDLIGYYIFTSETNVDGRDASTRMFAPRYGIVEESATGMAAGPLACFLNDHMGQVKEKYEIEQGYSMNPSSPSCINVVLSKEGLAIRSLKAGGTAAITRFEEIEI